jgi:hypothetical protein
MFGTTRRHVFEKEGNARTSVVGMMPTGVFWQRINQVVGAPLSAILFSFCRQPR